MKLICIDPHSQHGDVFTLWVAILLKEPSHFDLTHFFHSILLGRKINVGLGTGGSNMILNGKLSHVNAEEAYTHLTTP